MKCQDVTQNKKIKTKLWDIWGGGSVNTRITSVVD